MSWATGRALAVVVVLRGADARSKASKGPKGCRPSEGEPGCACAIPRLGRALRRITVSAWSATHREVRRARTGLPRRLACPQPGARGATVPSA
jgi:hypothetical protein